MRNYRKQDLKRFYGIDVIEYNALLAGQDNRCAICNKHMIEFDRHLAVDHDHETGFIRGLLCNNCNTGLGKLGDNIAGLERALQYLRDAEVRRSYAIKDK